MVGMDSEWRP
jgi:ribonuclease D